MPDRFNRFPQTQNSALLDGIDSFAPEFWRLVATEFREAEPNAPSSPLDAAPASTPPQPPRLTNEALQSLRESTGGLAKDLQDIPTPPLPPYPPFTGASPPPTNDSLRQLRESLPGSGEFLRDIPSPPEDKLPRLPNVAVPPVIADTVKEIWRQRAIIDRLEQERKNPARSQSDVIEFTKEIEKYSNSVRQLEENLEEGTRRSSRRI